LKSAVIEMASHSSNLSTLKQYLKTCSREELIDDIAELFKRFEPVKDYYQVKLSQDATQANVEVITKYKKIIENEFFPARGFGKAQLSVARKAVLDYKKVSNSPASVADIMLFYVEQGVNFTKEYGDIDEPFYNSMESMYKKATEWIVKHNMRPAFQTRARKIVENTSEMGWGFHDMLSEIYAETFSR
jgi:7-cyano-7-deazaguanine synthase in queuosine biosynthesis